MTLKKISIGFIRLFILTVIMVQSVIAEDVHTKGVIKHSIIQTNTHLSSEHPHNDKKIQLLKIKLSDQGKELFALRIKEFLKHSPPAVSSFESPTKVQLAMNKVPVLDQGKHGTCVTFAITGALDAAIDKGDYISQLCHLQLGSYLKYNGYSKFSGWDGAYPMDVIHQIEQFGIVNKEKQRREGCGNVTKYPTHKESIPESFIEPEQFYKMSEPIFGSMVNWYNIYWRVSSSWTLDEVKTGLQSGDRSVLTIVLPRIDLGLVGAVGRYKKKNDAWVLTPPIVHGIYSVTAAHEMIITGYDDDAVAVDNEGGQHQGLLTLRNSWGDTVGDYGNFYMSYDYFKILAYGVLRLSAVNR